MIKIMEHRGLSIFMDSKDQEYIRLVARWKNRESLAVFELEWGQLSKIRIYHREGSRMALPPKILLEFEDILSLYSYDFISLWARLHSKTTEEIETYGSGYEDDLAVVYPSHQ